MLSRPDDLEFWFEIIMITTVKKASDGSMDHYEGNNWYIIPPKYEF